jgi:hypothetical protein
MHQEGEGQAEAIFAGRSGGHMELARNERRVLRGLSPSGLFFPLQYPYGPCCVYAMFLVEASIMNRQNNNLVEG